MFTISSYRCLISTLRRLFPSSQQMLLKNERRGDCFTFGLMKMLLIQLSKVRDNEVRRPPCSSCADWNPRVLSPLDLELNHHLWSQKSSIGRQSGVLLHIALLPRIQDTRAESGKLATSFAWKGPDSLWRRSVIWQPNPKKRTAHKSCVEFSWYLWMCNMSCSFPEPWEGKNISLLLC